MATKARKDKKGYILRTGECQRANGKYSYSFTDRKGVRRSIYAMTLVKLREREKQLQLDYDRGLDIYAGRKITLNNLYDKYISQKFDLKPTTKSSYQYMYNHFVRDTLGTRKIGDIKYSDIRIFYYSILDEKKMKANTLDNIHSQLHPAFQMAVRDGVIRNNPTDGVMAEIKKGKLWEKPKRHALTVPQQQAFMNFIESNGEYDGWLPVITVLLGTGMRIGECLGLRWEDVDFKERIISVNHNLTYRPDETGVSRKWIQTPKTRASNRTIPMVEDVFQAFIREYEIQKCLGFCEEVIDGYSGFIFTTATHTVYSGEAINNAIRRATKAYNSQEQLAAKKEKREAVLLPKFSVHNLRHTFCTRFCENETNLKAIQAIMGHANISTTMDIYAEATAEKKKEVMTNLEGKVIIR